MSLVKILMESRLEVRLFAMTNWPHLVRVTDRRAARLVRAVREERERALPGHPTDQEVIRWAGESPEIARLVRQFVDKFARDWMVTNLDVWWSDRASVDRFIQRLAENCF